MPLKIERFYNEIHGTCDVLKLKKNNKEAADKVFRGLKARSKVRMNHFNVKMTEELCLSVSRSYQGTSKLPLA